MTTLKGSEWAKLLNVTILEPTGWDNINDYENRFITKYEFCNRAASSKLQTSVVATRREASSMLQKDFKKKV